jgi:hypothetical protein
LLHGFIMKKIENILFVPAVMLLFYSISKKNTAITDIHFSDTFIVVENRTIAGWFLAWLILVIICFKLIRMRHYYINKRFAAPYIILTLVLFLFFCLPLGSHLYEGGMSDKELRAWTFYNQVKMATGYSFLFLQVIFLIYFIFQLFRRPAYKP